MDCIKIKIFDEEDLTKTLVENYLKEFVTSYDLEKYNNFDEGLVTNYSENQIIIININKFDENILTSVAKLSSDKKNVFLAISYDSTTDLRVKVLRNGFKDFIIKPLIKSDFLYALQQIYKKYFQKNDNNIHKIVYSVKSADNDEEKNIFIYNLAAEVQKLINNEVLIIDIPVSEFNLSTFFNSPSTGNDKIMQYKQTSLFLMNAKPENINDEFIKKLKIKYNCIFININSKLPDNLKQNLIDLSDEVLYIVCEKSHKSIIKKDTDTLLKTKKINIIFNMFDSQKKLERMQSEIGMEIKYKITKNYTAIKQSILNKKTVNETDCNLDISKNYVNLAKEVMNRAKK